ncbi:hypothetical protein M3Y95_00418500 [Aphelenchoides besseyi]|nr:hypothetical protein M3Y95_00418500 [Aphelenchoides besseyi]
MSRRSRSRSRSRERRHRSSRRHSRERSKRSKERKHKHRKNRERTRSRSPISRYGSSPSVSELTPRPISPTPLSQMVGTSSSTAEDGSLKGLPEDVKRDLCAKDWDPDKMTGAALRWVSEQVAEQINARNQELDEIIRDRVAKAKIELEVRLRAQIEQEWKEEMEAARQREQDSYKHQEQLKESLAAKIREVEEEKIKLSDERLEMLATKSKLEMERNQLKEELEKMKKEEQNAIINKGGFQRAPIRMKFGK